MKYWIKIDLWLIGMFEKFSYFTEDWIGLSSIFWARLFLALYVSTAIIFAFVTKDYVLPVLAIPIFFGHYIYSELSRKKADKIQTGSQTANSFKHEARYSLRRLILLVLCCNLVWAMAASSKPVPKSTYLLSILLWCYWLSHMFLTCDPRPYKPSKLKEWINSFSQKPAMQEN